MTMATLMVSSQTGTTEALTDTTDVDSDTQPGCSSPKSPQASDPDNSIPDSSGLSIASVPVEVDCVA